MRKMKNWICFLLVALFVLNNATAVEITLQIPSGVKVIEEEAFANIKHKCDTTSIDISLPNGIERIESRAFADNHYADQHIYLPSSLSYIASDAFENSYYVTAYVAPDTYAQEFCDEYGLYYRLPEVSSNGFLYSNNELWTESVDITGYTGDAFDLYIPIYIYTSDEDGKKTEKKVIEISDGAFAGMTQLKKVHIPNVDSIGESAFENCGNIEEICLWNGGTPVTFSEPDVLGKIKEIGANAFAGCTSLKKMELPVDYLTTIGSRAYAGCASLTELILPSSLTSIGEDAFVDCPNLTLVVDDGSYAHNYCKDNDLNYELIDEFSITVLDDNTCAVTGYNGSETSVAVPEIIDGYTVVEIGNNAFVDTDIESISLPSTLTQIGIFAFHGCSNLTNIVVPDSVTYIGRGAFSYSGLVMITLPKRVDFFGTAMFQGCISLQEVDLPEGVARLVVEEDMLEYCRSLKELGLPATMKEIDIYILNGSTYGWPFVLEHITVDEGNPWYYTEDDALFTADGKTILFHAIGNDETEYTIRDGVEAIGKACFEGKSNLISVKMPDSLISVGEYAFYECSNLAEVTISDGVVSIGAYAFALCDSLKNVVIPDSVTDIGENAFDADVLIQAEEDSYAYQWAVENGYTVEVIKPYVFTGENSVIYSCIYGTAKVVGYSGTASELVIPDSVEGYPVTAIGADAFATTSTLSECCSLTSIVIPDSVTTIEDRAFYDCDNLENIELSSNLVTIGRHAFFSCGNLREIKLPDSVEEICNSAFAFCYSLVEIDMPAKLKAIGVQAFLNCGFSELELPEGLVSIGSSAFINCYYLTHLKIPKSVTSIGSQIFNCYVNAAEVVPGSYAEEYCIENEVPIYVDGYDFAYVVSGSSTASVAAYSGADTVVTIPSEINGYDITKISERCFLNKEMITKIIVPESVTGIEKFAFKGCSCLSEIEIPSSVTSIGERAFYECASLTEIRIPANVTSVGVFAFQLCSSLTSIIVEDGNKNYASLDGVLFADDEKTLHTYPMAKQGDIYAIPDGVVAIGEGAFHMCRGLTSVQIPNTTTSIRDYAFNNCSSLTSIVIPESVTSIGDYVFYYVGEGFAAQVVDGSYAHSWCIENEVPFAVVN